MINPDDLTDEEFIQRTFDDLDRIYGEGESADGEQVQGDEAEPSGEGELQERPENEEVSPPVEGGEGDEHGDGSEPGGPDVGSKTVTLPSGQTLAIDEIQRYYDFEQFLKSHPDVAQRVVQAAQGQPDLSGSAPAPTLPEPPADLDLDDPAIKFLYDQNVANTRALETIARQQQEAAQATAIEHANIAVRQVKDRLNLNDEQLGQLRVATAELNIVPTFISRNPSNPISAMEQALEFTFWSQPQFRDAAIQARIDAEVASSSADTKRQRNLNKVSNSSGGSKPPPAKKEPSTEEERREAMIQEISEAMGR